MTDTDVLYERHGAVGVATLSRPRVLNAFRPATLERVSAILDDVAADPEVRTLVVTGTGRAFSSGIDLKELASNGLTRDELELGQQLTEKLVALPKIVIAAVNGLAVGLGAEFCVAADIRIAADSAWFMFPEVRRALFETNGVTYLLPRLVGLGRAVHWLTTGSKITVEEAPGAGLVTKVVPSSDLLNAALEEAETIANNAPIPVRLLKQMLQRSYQSDLTAMLRHEVDGVLACMQSRDYREGVNAFLEKRTPRFTGE